MMEMDLKTVIRRVLTLLFSPHFGLTSSIQRFVLFSSFSLSLPLVKKKGTLPRFGFATVETAAPPTFLACIEKKKNWKAGTPPPPPFLPPPFPLFASLVELVHCDLPL